MLLLIYLSMKCLIYYSRKLTFILNYSESFYSEFYYYASWKKSAVI